MSYTALSWLMISAAGAVAFLVAWLWERIDDRMQADEARLARRPTRLPDSGARANNLPASRSPLYGESAAGLPRSKAVQSVTAHDASALEEAGARGRD